MTDIPTVGSRAPIYQVCPGDFTTVPFGPTPSQTVGPYWHIGLPWKDGPEVVLPSTPGRVTVAITVLDGAGAPIADAMVETWQADAGGRFDHPADPRGAQAPTVPGFRGFSRSGADATGTAVIHTVIPGSLPAEVGRTEAPHINVSIFARGMLDRLVTRLYFPDDTAAHDSDPVLNSLAPADRAKLIAAKNNDGYAFTVHVQDDDPNGLETPFFDF